MNISTTDRPVVVGVRDEQPGLLDFAHGLAGLLSSPLRVVHACHVPYPYAYAPLSVKDLPDSIVASARSVLTEAEEHLGSGSEQTEIAYDLVAGFPPAVLGAESYGARVVVVGTDDVGWLDRVTGEAVTNFLCLHAQSPVVVVPPAVESFAAINQVLVCVDAQSAAAGLMRFSFDLADRGSLEVRVLHVMHHREAKEIETARLAIAEVLAGWSEDYPDVTVTTELVEGHDPSEETAHVAADGALVVVERPQGGPLRAWRSSAAHTLKVAGRWPIAVVPPGDTP